jgi:hypothetical protein
MRLLHSCSPGQQLQLLAARPSRLNTEWPGLQDKHKFESLLVWVHHCKAVEGRPKSRGVVREPLAEAGRGRILPNSWSALKFALNLSA